MDLNPACTLTLESGTKVVIVAGTSTATSAGTAGLGARLSIAFEKYHPDYAPKTAGAGTGPPAAAA